MRWFITAAAIAFLGGLITGKSVLAQESEVFWAAKPIQCGPSETAFQTAEQEGLKPAFLGYGYSNSVNYDEPIPVLLALYLDPNGGKFVIMEIAADGEEGCIIGQGDGTDFNPANINSIIESFRQE